MQAAAGTTHPIVSACVPSSLTAASTTTTTTMTQLKQPQLKPTATRPWYAAGGMRVNLTCMALNIVVPIYVLGQNLAASHQTALLALLVTLCATSAIPCRTSHCVVVVPVYLTSLFLALPLRHPLFLVTAALVLGIVKINICMSVCLHRYAAHAAFKCGPVTNIALCLAGCLADQGGPLWWASQHRCHHKYCDMPRDPHSPTLMGIERAFEFFNTSPLVDEEFVPHHLGRSSGWLLRVLDTWAWSVLAVELALAYYLFGDEGLYCAFTSGWICQTITLWFNVANHPPEHATAKVCKASDGTAPLADKNYYLPFYLFDALLPFFGFFIMEGEHEHHHMHASLAKRSRTDIAYWTFIKPLEMLGLVWDVVVK